MPIFDEAFQDDVSLFTADPDLSESDAGLGTSAVYYDEAGARKGYPERNALQSCEACGSPVIEGELKDGTRVAVEPQTLTYVLYWRQKTTKRGASVPPTLTLSRGYPAHRCRSDSHGRQPD